MNDLAYLNGQFLPANDIRLPVTDWGFVQGVTLAEQLRTFRGVPFCVEQHLERLLSGLRIVGWEPIVAELDLPKIIIDVAEQNHCHLDPCDDLGLCIFITPGTYPGYRTYPSDRTAEADESTVCVHTYSLPFHRWQKQYQDGLTLVTVPTRQVPATCWPPELKCRSRMHYYLAAKEAQSQMPGATALLLDQDGNVAETPTANVVAYFADSGLVSPPQEKILPGISLHQVVELAKSLGVDFHFRDLTPTDLAAANEVMLASTPYCLLPVVRLDDQHWDGPGPVYQELLRAWSTHTTVDIAAQATRFARRT